MVRRLPLLATVALALVGFVTRAQAVCSTHWDVVSSMTSASSWESLQFDIGYSSATGRFAGTDAGVRCTNLVSGALYAPADHDTSAPRALTQGWIAFSPRPAPTPLSRCTFLSTGDVSASDFTVTITSAAGPTVGLSATCSRCGNGVLDPGETCDPRISGQECCNADNCSAIVSGCNLCGNGIVNAGEQCDDYENLSGDCCSSTCRFESSGSLCGSAATSCSLADTCNGSGTCRANDRPDGTACAVDLCHADGTCTAGACSNGGEALCDDANRCTRDECDLDTGACSFVSAPATGCLAAAASSLLLSTAHEGKAIWKWDHGQTTQCGEFEAPDSETDYDVCVYDSIDDDQYTLASGFHVPATARWRLDERGDECSWIYTDKTTPNDGIKRLALASGPDGRASIALSALGSRTPIPTPAGSEQFLRAGSSVVVQMFNGSGTCWESTFTEALKNDGKKFRASVK